VSYDAGRAALRLDYTIVPEDDHPVGSGAGEVELWLSPTHAWEAQISTRAASDKVSGLPWTVHAARSDGAEDRTVVRVTHAPVPMHSVSALKVKLVIELGGGSRGTLRLNGVPHAVSPARASPRPETGLGFAPKAGLDILSAFPSPSAPANRSSIGGRAESIISPSVTTTTTQSRAPSITSSARLVPSTSSRPPAIQKAVQTLIRRSYTYFTALLQEPDQKWRPLLESRGVTVTQLDSIDPTLVVFRAEATFVGVGVWDLLGALGCEPARMVWEKGVEDVRLVEDVNELTELWWVKNRAAWPVKCVYSTYYHQCLTDWLLVLAPVIHFSSKRRTNPLQPHTSFHSPQPIQHSSPRFPHLNSLQSAHMSTCMDLQSKRSRLPPRSSPCLSNPAEGESRPVRQGWSRRSRGSARW
jgi:hypothetical protein